MAYTPTLNFGCTPKSKATCESLRERAELDSHVSSEAYIDDTTNLRQEFREAISSAARMFPPAKPGEYTEAEFNLVKEYLIATHPALVDRTRHAILEITFDELLEEIVAGELDDDDKGSAGHSIVDERALRVGSVTVIDNDNTGTHTVYRSGSAELETVKADLASGKVHDA